ncbi:hypothetical protein CEXT_99161 [Caerostris extrusa]|uniref:Secreted protein n=1 Tax=Caerostris extrusa TaxID=172846 RepID=A0AAV4P0U9_CAEEX|nr:hypothetical protein CEXT_99161 [Caerostris extrusa]
MAMDKSSWVIWISLILAGTFLPIPHHNKPNTPAGWIRGRPATPHRKDHRFSIIVLMANPICCHCRKHSPVCMTSVTRCWIIWNNSLSIDRTF